MARLTLIIPFLNENDNLHSLHKRLCEVLPGLPIEEVEVVLVDDGSTDGSVATIRAFPPAPFLLRLVRLSRNFGGHAGVAAGIQQSTGDVITYLPADLQDPPEILAPMLEQWRAGHEIVWAKRETRDDPWLSKLLSGMYHGLMRRFALPQYPQGGVDICMFDRCVVESLGSLQERNSNIPCLLMWAGFSQCFVPYARAERKAGRSKWSFGKRIKLFADSFVAFSFFPMRLISAVGALLSMAGILYALIIAVQAVLGRVAVQGWSSLMVAVLLCSGVQLLMLGILSEYLWRALEAARNRPMFIVRQTETLSQGRLGAAGPPEELRARSRVAEEA